MRARKHARLSGRKKDNQILLLQTPRAKVKRKDRISCSLVSRYTRSLSLLPFANFHLLMLGPPKHFHHRRNTTKTTVETFGRDQQIARPNNAGTEGQKDKGAPAPPSRRCMPDQTSQPHIGAHSSAVGDSHLPSWGRRSFTSGMVSRPSSGTKNK